MAGMAQRVLQREAAAVRVPQHRHLLVPEMRAERVGVVGELRERERLDGRASGAAVATMVIVHEAQHFAERVEPFAELRVIVMMSSKAAVGFLKSAAVRALPIEMRAPAS